MSAGAAFDRTARDYDESRCLLIPCFDDFYAGALDLLPSTPRRVLDLGAGTGLLAALVRSRHARAELVLADVAPEMLRTARERFAGDPRVSFEILDLEDPRWTAPRRSTRWSPPSRSTICRMRRSARSSRGSTTRSSRTACS